MSDADSGCGSPVRRARTLRVYVSDSIVPFEEDATHEFKGHRNISEEELPPWIFTPKSDKPTRKAISRTLNGFLNSGRASTVYIGILDNGTVKGHNLSVFMRDHITASLEDTFSRYNPPVERHRWTLQFIPVVEPNSTQEERRNIVLHDPYAGVTKKQRERAHTLRTHNYCWCHKDQRAAFENGVMENDYVIEIQIHAWDPSDERNQTAIGHMKAPPVHEDETGNAYFRRQGGVQPISPMELYSIKKQMATDHYRSLISSLRQELHELRRPSDGITS